MNLSEFECWILDVLKSYMCVWMDFVRFPFYNEQKDGEKKRTRKTFVIIFSSFCNESKLKTLLQFQGPREYSGVILLAAKNILGFKWEWVFQWIQNGEEEWKKNNNNNSSNFWFGVHKYHVLKMMKTQHITPNYLKDFSKRSAQ